MPTLQSLVIEEEKHSRSKLITEREREREKDIIGFYLFFSLDCEWEGNKLFSWLMVSLMTFRVDLWYYRGYKVVSWWWQTGRISIYITFRNNTKCSFYFTSYFYFCVFLSGCGILGFLSVCFNLPNAKRKEKMQYLCRRAIPCN